MSVNGKMRPVETIPGMEGSKGEWGRVEFYSKNLGKCHNVPPV
jgi:hypothetical protein